MEWLSVVIIGLLYLGLAWLIRNYPDTVAGYSMLPEWKKRRVNLTGIAKDGSRILKITGWGIILAGVLFQLLDLPEAGSYSISALAILGPLWTVVSCRQYWPRNNKRS